MANSLETPAKHATSRTIAVAARTLALSASVGFIVSSFLSLKVVPIFATLFSGLGVKPPAATDILVTKYAWLSALFFCGALVAPIATELLVPATARRMVIARSFLVAASVSVLLVVLFLYLPVLVLFWKVQSH